MRGWRALLLLSGILSAPLQASPAFDDYVVGLKREAVAAGISPATVEAAFADIRIIEAAIKHDKNQPEFKLTLDSYIPAQCPKGKSIRPKPYIANICRCSRK